jgi:hypothetical protein
MDRQLGRRKWAAQICRSERVQVVQAAGITKCLWSLIQLAELLD